MLQLPEPFGFVRGAPAEIIEDRDGIERDTDGDQTPDRRIDPGTCHPEGIDLRIGGKETLRQPDTLL